MKLARQKVAILLSEEGRAALEPTPVASRYGKAPAFQVEVLETDELGIWVRVEDAHGKCAVLVRWAYVLSVVVPMPGDAESIGFD